MHRLEIARLVALLHRLDRAERFASRMALPVDDRTTALVRSLKALSDECQASPPLSPRYVQFSSVANQVDLASRESTADTLRSIETARESLTFYLAGLCVWCLSSSELHALADSMSADDRLKALLLTPRTEKPPTVRRRR